MQSRHLPFARCAFLVASAALAPHAPLVAQQYDIFTAWTNQPRVLADCAIPFADLDKDGTTDFLIGDAFASVDAKGQGVVQVRSGLDGSVLRQQLGGPGEQLGGSLIVLDDVDNDGMRDYAVGSTGFPFNSATQETGRGGVRVFSGQSGSELYSVHSDKVPTKGVRFGTDLALLDDLDNDGLRDYCICGLPDSGATVLFVSAKTGSVIRQFAYPITAEVAYRVVAAQDFDLDGVSDVCAKLSAPAIVIVSSRTGLIVKTYTGFTPAALDGDLDATRDLDGDGALDFVVGVLHEGLRVGSKTGTTGTVYAISSRTSAVIWRLQLTQFDSKLGQSFCSIDDINADNVADFVIGADRVVNDAPGVLIVSGKDGTVLETRTDVIGSESGALVRSAGDLNHDGHEDYFHASGQFPVQYTTTAALRLQSTIPLSLVAKTHRVPLITGGYQQLDLDAGSKHANALVFVLGTASGTNPGISLGPIHLPLNPDVYFSAVASSPHTFVFHNLARLDANGRGQAAFSLPPNHPASLAGVTLHHAFVTLPNLDFASNAVPVRLTLFP